MVASFLDHADILISGLTLYPGDQISYECSGWDPQDGPLKWTMQLCRCPLG